MTMIDQPVELTPREHMQMEWEKEESARAREYAITIKQLELAIIREKNQADIELKKLEAKWSSWLRLPSMIIKLPIYVFLGIGYVVDAIRGNEPGPKFWTFLK